MAWLFLNMAGGTSQPTPSGEEPFELAGYQSWEGSVGIRYPLGEGMLVGEIGLNHLSSGNEYYGSNRNLVFVGAGYRYQLPGLIKWLHLQGGVRFGINDFSVNFGNGVVPLPEEVNFPVIFSGQLGAQYCFTEKACGDIFIGPQYEHSLIGEPAYSDFRILTVGVGLSFDIQEEQSEKPSNDGTQQLQEEILRLTAENAHLRNEKAQLVSDLRQKDALPLCVEKIVEQEMAPAPPPLAPSTEELSLISRLQWENYQLAAENKRLKDDISAIDLELRDKDELLGKCIELFENEAK